MTTKIKTKNNPTTPDITRDWETVYEQKSTPWDVAEPEDELVNLVRSKVIQPCRILELGCGHGNDSIFLAKNGFEVTAIDISERAITEAQRRAKEAKVNIQFLVEDASQLHLLEEPFQVIYDRACFHFITFKKRRSYLTNLNRLLEKNGYFILIASSDQERVKGPYQFSKDDLQNIFGKVFEILELRLITLQQHAEKPTPYFCLMRKK